MKLNRYTLAGFLAIILWSSTVALSRSISEKVGPLVLGFMVYTTAGALLAVSALLQKRKLQLHGGQVATTAVRGLLFLVYTFSLYLALGQAADRLQAVEIGLLNYLWPSLTLLLSLVLLRKHANGWLVPGTLLGLVGIVLVLTQGSGVSWHSFSRHILGSPLSYGLGLLAAVSWALYSNMTRRWNASASEWDMPLFMLATGLAFGLAMLFAGQAFEPHSRVVMEILLLAAFTASGYLLWDIAMRAGDMVLVAAASYLTPFFSTLVSTLYLQVTPRPSLWLGCLLIIAGSFISWRSFSETRRPDLV
ncbi:MAG: aromatic amino acid DMT transporter YddG [Anaerolineaceae bacterium]